ncbi:MAG: PhnD/SsuA/transferrin family substrate-binding protein, partial [Duodenibacillus sp.]|nr:PhnD/SsuA/transferrin family substrate-binding protein [Duodenibacillus sp.]
RVQASDNLSLEGIYRSYDEDLQRIEDLRGKVLAVNQPRAFSGWIIPMGEIARRGHDWRRFFKSVDFTYHQSPDILLRVLAGTADAGVLNACTLEALVADGILDGGALRVLEPRKTGKLACLHSTDLYPGVILSAFQKVDSELIRDVTVAILSMPAGRHFKWGVDNDIRSLDALYKSLQIGPYAYLHDSAVSTFLSEHAWEIGLAAALLLWLVANELRLEGKVRRRTRELELALEQKQAMAELARKTGEHIARLERIGIINQMGSMVAHELKQPVASVINYAVGARMRLKALRLDDDLLRQGLEQIGGEASRIAGIIDRVRGFAKASSETFSPMDLSEAVRRAVSNYKNNHAGAFGDIREDVAAPAMILGDSLSLELAVLNLVKNAASEAAKVPRGFVAVTLRKSGGLWRLAVANSGGHLDEAAFGRLTANGQSLKSEGLGLGLSIVRTIADSHGARLQFLRRPEGGLEAIITFDPSDAAGPTEEAS